MPENLPLVDTLPDAPSRANPDDFDVKADAFLAAWQPWPVKFNECVEAINALIPHLERAPGTVAYEAMEKAKLQVQAAAAEVAKAKTEYERAAAETVKSKACQTQIQNLMVTLSNLATGSGVFSAKEVATYVDSRTLRLDGNRAPDATTGRILILHQTPVRNVFIESATFADGKTTITVDAAVTASLTHIQWGIPSGALPAPIVEQIAQPAIVSHKNGDIIHGGTLRASEPRLAYAPKDSLKHTLFWMCSDEAGEHVVYPVQTETGLEHELKVHLLQTNTTYYPFCSQETDKGAVSRTSAPLKLTTADVLQFVAPPTVLEPTEGGAVTGTKARLVLDTIVVDPSQPAQHTKTEYELKHTSTGNIIKTEVVTDSAKLREIPLPFMERLQDMELWVRVYDEVRGWSGKTVVQFRTNEISDFIAMLPSLNSLRKPIVVGETITLVTYRYIITLNTVTGTIIKSKQTYKSNNKGAYVLRGGKAVGENIVLRGFFSTEGSSYNNGGDALALYSPATGQFLWQRAFNKGVSDGIEDMQVTSTHIFLAGFFKENGITKRGVMCFSIANGALLWAANNSSGNMPKRGFSSGSNMYWFEGNKILQISSSGHSQSASKITVHGERGHIGYVLDVVEKGVYAYMVASYGHSDSNTVWLQLIKLNRSNASVVKMMRIQLAAKPTYNVTEAFLSVTNKNIYVSFEERYYACLDINTLAPKWCRELEGNNPYFAYTSAVSDGIIISACYDNSVAGGDEYSGLFIKLTGGDAPELGVLPDFPSLSWVEHKMNHTSQSGVSTAIPTTLKKVSSTGIQAVAMPYAAIKNHPVVSDIHYF